MIITANTASFPTALAANQGGAVRKVNQCPVDGGTTVQSFHARCCTTCSYSAELETAEELALFNPAYTG